MKSIQYSCISFSTIAYTKVVATNCKWLLNNLAEQIDESQAVSAMDYHTSRPWHKMRIRLYVQKSNQVNFATNIQLLFCREWCKNDQFEHKHFSWTTLLAFFAVKEKGNVIMEVKNLSKKYGKIIVGRVASSTPRSVR